MCEKKLEILAQCMKIKIKQQYHDYFSTQLRKLIT